MQPRGRGWSSGEVDESHGQRSLSTAPKKQTELKVHDVHMRSKQQDNYTISLLNIIKSNMLLDSLIVERLIPHGLYPAI